MDSIFATTQYFQHGLRQNALSGGVCEWAASACYRWYTGLSMRTRLLADLTTKEFETIFDEKDGVLNSLKYPKRESFQFRSEQSFFMDFVT